jgi:tetratricopeptide (TPR) repeat protein
VQFDREETLRRAEQFLRQGRLDLAIVQYVRILEDQPRDWITANVLGDLYVRAGDPDRAAAQYSRLAGHFMQEGFYSKSAAIYKKILKLRPDDEVVQLQLADVSQKQGLLADARAYLGSVAARRRARGDHAGATEITVRIGDLDPADVDARLTAARALAGAGDKAAAAVRLRDVADLLREKGRAAEALDALGEAVRLDPADREGRIQLAKAAMSSGDAGAAREWLEGQEVGDDPDAWLALLEADLEAERSDAVRELAGRLAASGPATERVLALAWRTAARRPDDAYVLVDGAVTAAVTEGRHAEAAQWLREFVAKAPGHVEALLRLVDVSVLGGLEHAMTEGQALLADAYLAAGCAEDARAVAEDLVAREPWEQAHLERFRRALDLLDHPEPDTVIAERLGGRSPFTTVDRFAPAEPSGAAPQPEEPPAAAPAEPDERLAAATPPEDLDTVSSTVRDDVERQGGADREAQQMALARTYLEIGMEDEAVKALHGAATSLRFRFEAASRLGRLYQQRGEWAAAAEWLKRASEAPAHDIDEGHAVLYDLGVVVELCGDRTRALAILLELQANAGPYRDVAERIARLARVETGG